jgi:cation diffusion facilitator family transporter
MWRDVLSFIDAEGTETHDECNAMTSQGIPEGLRAVRSGIIWNACLAIVKLLAGIFGNTYALIADAIESIVDMVTSAVVYRGLEISSRVPSEEFPFGYGKAEAMAAATVSLTLLGAAVLIAYHAVQEILTPHMAPAPWTLLVLVGVIAVKWILSRRMRSVGDEIGSIAVRAEAWHHRSDALTSAAAFLGIGIAVVATRVNPGTHWSSADDWATLVASAVIAYNGSTILRTAAMDLMDRAPGPEVVATVRSAAESVIGVLATEKIAVRKTGLVFRVTLHVQATPEMTLHEAHVLSGKVKGAICRAEPKVGAVLVHMEPYEG